MAEGRRSFGDALVTSLNATEKDPLKGPPPADAHNTYPKLALCLGLSTANNVKRWLNSPEFLPIYEELYNRIIAPKRARGDKSQGPQYLEVSAAIYKGEAFGNRRYDPRARTFNTNGWQDVDWYAFCLVSLRNENKLSRDGIFRGKVMNDSEIDSRLWKAMLKMTASRAPTILEKKRKKQDEKAQKEADAQASLENVFSSQRSKKHPSFSDDEESPPNTPKRRSLGPATPRPEKPQSASSPVTQDPDDPFVQDNTSGVESVADTNDARRGGGLEQPGPEDLPVREQFDGMEYLRVTRNPDNPTDITTPYGAYVTIQNVLRNFDDKISLQRLASGPTITPEMTAQQMSEATRLWEKELEAIVDHMPELDLTPPTNEDLERHAKYEKLLDNPKYQPKDFDGSCEHLHLDREFPNFPSMNPTIKLEGWQVTGIKKIWDMYIQKRSRGAILADAMGLGKTYQMFGFWLFHYFEVHRAEKEYQAALTARSEAIAAYDAWEDDPDNYEIAPEEQNDDQPNPVNLNPHIIPPQPQPPRKVLPKLIVVLPELITQTYNSLHNFSGNLKGLVYYDDNRSTKSAREYRVEGLLKNTNALFNGDLTNEDYGIITTLPTLRNRHGPQALYEWRKEVLNMTSQQAKAMWNIPDPNWPGLLRNCFEIVCIDEAHTIKNMDTAGHTTIAWLNAEYHLLITASVLGNRLSDYIGFARLIQPSPDQLATDANFQQWSIDKTTNPFELADNHPGAILRQSLSYIDKYITSEKNKNYTERNSLYLRKVWEQVLIRRTYASPNPAKPHQNIGQDLPGLYTRRIVCSFTKEEQEAYDKLAELPMRKLIIKLPHTDQLAWNRKFSRLLTLLSTWIGWHYIEKEYGAKTIVEWKRLDHLLWRFCVMFHRGMRKQGLTPNFDIPAKDDIAAQLSIICMGSPKIRATLRIIAELVILNNYKLTMWSSLPANQVLLHAILEALNIGHATFTADLDRSERDEEVRQFTENESCMVWNGGYYVGSYGLDLQPQAHHSCEWDGPPTKAHKDQAIGRLRRFGQRFNVEHFELYVTGSFQTRVIISTMEKAVPCALAELSINISKKHDNINNNNIELDIGTWYLSPDGDLISEFDAGAANLAAADQTPLLPDEFIHALQEMGRGEASYLKTHPSEIWEDESIDLALGLPGEA
ncbi:P-loop containing nucleoside triphosphate hydrolase protein [Hyaloscypha sp. PMI_1271]|nr:P-loop containing nucleoside triphosphate hydrolase protein [Hyaloscypha sp. PMI_1271]